MIKNILLLFLISCTVGYSQNKTLSNQAEISIITSGPGDDLYEKFGHTAIRIKDSELNFDMLYNYGIFDFNAPNFYTNFTKGKLIYKLVKYPFHFSLSDANKDGRWTKQQILNLTPEQKKTFFRYLETNTRPENASYEYDPFFNNCATKPKDIIKIILGNQLVLSEDFTTRKQSLRQLMNTKIHWNTWGSLGINLALGTKLDQVISPEAYLYLPEYLFKALSLSKTIKNGEQENLVQKTNILLDFKQKKLKSDCIGPFLVFSILLLISLFITYKDYKENSRTKWLDFLLFFSTGLIGLFVMFLWFFTNHSTTPNNFNCLWAFAPNSIIAFLLWKNNLKKWIKKYILLILFLIVVTFILWGCRIQLFSTALIPFLLLLTIRYVFLIKTL